MSIEQIALDVQAEFGMSGLAEGVYLDFAREVAKRHAQELASKFYAEEPARTCATCFYFEWLEKGGVWWCKSRKTPVVKGGRTGPDSFGCNHHAPKEPTP